MGDISKFTPERAQRIIDATRAGATKALAAKAGGVTRKTLWQWLSDGENAKSGKKKKFYEDFTEAESERAMKALAQIQASADEGNWTAAAWYLERRYPHEYGRQKIETTNDNKLEIVVVRSDES